MLGRRILRPTPTKLVLNLQKSEHDANHFSIKNVLETTSNETNKVSPTVERLFEEQKGLRNTKKIEFLQTRSAI